MSKGNEEKGSLLLKIPLLKKLKNVKGIEWIVVGLGCLIVFIIYFSTSNSNTVSSSSSISYSSSAEYAKELEQKLSAVLSNVSGAGKVSVMVTIESGAEIKVATSKEERTNSSSGTTNNTQSVTIVESPVIIGKEPLVLMEIMPKVKGVIVVAQGASNVSVKLELLRAINALIDVDASQIEIFVGK